MNPQTRNITLRRCVVCDYPFSDEHHVYPRHRSAKFGATKTGKAVIALCPNHHRFANIAQGMVEQCLQAGSDCGEVIRFGGEYFDDAFNKLLPQLIDAHILEETRVADEIMGE